MSKIYFIHYTCVLTVVQKRGKFFTNMIPKILHWLGLVACITLIIACFVPWTYYPDIHKTFTGFYSEQNEYGRPGMFLVPIAVIIFIFILLPKVWAKRANLFLGGLELSFAIKTTVLFASCYDTHCPEKRVGIYLMLLSAIAIMIIVLFPDIKLKGNEK